MNQGIKRTGRSGSAIKLYLSSPSFVSAERGHNEDKGHQTLPCLLTEAWSVEGWRGLQLSPSSPYLLSLMLIFIVMGVRTLFNFARKHVSTVDIISYEVCSKQVEG